MATQTYVCFASNWWIRCFTKSCAAALNVDRQSVLSLDCERFQLRKSDDALVLVQCRPGNTLVELSIEDMISNSCIVRMTDVPPPLELCSLQIRLYSTDIADSEYDGVGYIAYTHNRTSHAAVARLPAPDFFTSAFFLQSFRVVSLLTPAARQLQCFLHRLSLFTSQTLSNDFRSSSVCRAFQSNFAT